MVMFMNPRAVPPVTHGSALQAPEYLWFVFYHGLTDYVLWMIEEIKKFVAFPRQKPLQTDAYAQS